MCRKTKTNNIEHERLPQAEWCPWQFGSARLSELSIEQLLGRLRRRQSNAQLSPMQFWEASQREMLRASNQSFKDCVKLKDIQKEAALTETELLVPIMVL